MLIECLADDRPFRVLHVLRQAEFFFGTIMPSRFGRRVRFRRLEGITRNELDTPDHEVSLDRILQLTHSPRPFVTDQHLDHMIWDPRHLRIVALKLEEVLQKKGDALYDGGISPGPGLDKKGPTAVLKSCAKIDHVTDGRAFLLNQRLSPTQLEGEKGYQLWKAYMKTWAELGLDHVQFNLVSDQTLRAAQQDPEKYQEVIVRVAGYSAHFVDISRKTQDNIIQRTVQGIG